MTPAQAIGWTLINTSAVTAIVGASTQSRIFYGLRPQASSLSSLPCVNFYEIGGGTRANGLGAQPYSINCRATTPGAARSLAMAVLDVFAGTSGTGVYGIQNGFDVARASLKNDGGLVPETDTGAYNAPVDILLVYPLDTVS